MNQETSPSRLSLVSVHESGHAVVAWLRNVSIRRVCMQRDANTQAHVEIIGKRSSANVIDIYVAGAVAETLYDPKSKEPDVACFNDYLNAQWEMIDAGLAEDGDEEALGKLWGEATEGVRVLLQDPEVWPLVLALASHLVPGEIVSGRMVNQILSKVWEARSSP